MDIKNTGKLLFKIKREHNRTFELVNNFDNLYVYISPEFASRSLHVGFVVDETGSG